MRVPGQFLKSSLTSSLESLMLWRDINNQEAWAELVQLPLAGKTAWGCLAEAIQCLLLSNSLSYEKLKLTSIVEYVLLKYKLPSVTLELSWFFQALRAYLCLVLGLVLALQLWMCIKWIHFHIHLRFLHFWLLFWRSGFANKGIERKKGIQFLLLVPCSPPLHAYKFILRSAFFSSLFKMSEFDLDLLAVTAGNGLWRKIWAWGWISARDAVCTWHSLRQILAWNEIQGATLCQDAECWGVGVRDLYD